MSIIAIKNLCFRYETTLQEEALTNIDLEIRRGECVVLTGESGCGKTTLTRCINGLVPDFYGGRLTGELLYEDKPLSEMPQYEASAHIGTVFQDPRSQFFTVNSTDEVAFGCENLSFSTEKINQNVDAAFSQLNRERLRDKSLFELSSGEKQQLAVASICAIGTDVIILDEPTANLDDEAIQSLRRLLSSLKAEGKTLIISEHRLSWLDGIAERYVHIRHGRIDKIWNARDAVLLPAATLREYGLRSMRAIPLPTGKAPTQDGKSELVCDRLSVFHGKQKAIHDLSFRLTWGEEGKIIGITGKNGSGKTTLSKALCGLLNPKEGTISLNGKK
jgi:energy-coupling factor transport system ATP-binding protein